MLVAIRITTPVQDFFLLKVFFIFYCDSYGQLRIKHENPRRRFALHRVLSNFWQHVANTGFQFPARSFEESREAYCVEMAISAKSAKAGAEVVLNIKV